jgi:hypothetical protein
MEAICDGCGKSVDMMGDAYHAWETIETDRGVFTCCGDCKDDLWTIANQVPYGTKEEVHETHNPRYGEAHETGCGCAICDQEPLCEICFRPVLSCICEETDDMGNRRAYPDTREEHTMDSRTYTVEINGQTFAGHDAFTASRAVENARLRGQDAWVVLTLHDMPGGDLVTRLDPVPQACVICGGDVPAGMRAYCQHCCDALMAEVDRSFDEMAKEFAA